MILVTFEGLDFVQFCDCHELKYQLEWDKAFTIHPGRQFEDLFLQLIVDSQFMYLIL